MKCGVLYSELLASRKGNVIDNGMGYGVCGVSVTNSCHSERSEGSVLISLSSKVKRRVSSNTPVIQSGAKDLFDYSDCSSNGFLLAYQ